MTSTDEKSPLRRFGIRDVARNAKVGVGTVSRVLNGHPSVSVEVRDLVKAVMAEMRYTPDSIAQNMRRKTSKTLGVIIPDLSNPFFAELVQAIETVARTRDYHIYLMSSHDDPQTERECVESLTSRKVDGIVLVPSNSDKAVPDTSGTRMVLVDRIPEGLPGVAANHYEGSRHAVSYLRSLGHQRIACIAGPMDSVTAQGRLNGFLSIMTPQFEEMGLRVADYLVSGAFDVQTGRLATEKFIAMPTEDRPTAIFASADQQAIGALRAASDLGINVPGQLSIMGYDGTPISDLVKPRLSTVVQPVGSIAKEAVEQLLDVASDKRPWTKLFDCKIIERESCGPAPGSSIRKPT